MDSTQDNREWGNTATAQCPQPCPARETEWNHSCTDKFYGFVDGVFDPEQELALVA